jgi:predicted Co/Zn/Cd cation transporter (cation efflux family)
MISFSDTTFYQKFMVILAAVLTVMSGIGLIFGIFYEDNNLINTCLYGLVVAFICLIEVKLDLLLSTMKTTN